MAGRFVSADARQTRRRRIRRVGRRRGHEPVPSGRQDVHRGHQRRDHVPAATGLHRVVDRAPHAHQRGNVQKHASHRPPARPDPPRQGDTPRQRAGKHRVRQRVAHPVRRARARLRTRLRRHRHGDLRRSADPDREGPRRHGARHQRREEPAHRVHGHSTAPQRSRRRVQTQTLPRPRQRGRHDVRGVQRRQGRRPARPQPMGQSQPQLPHAHQTRRDAAHAQESR
nr:MAG TPA: hypothetical protein [Caudoviricetes sp.]